MSVAEMQASYPADFRLLGEKERACPPSGSLVQVQVKTTRYARGERFWVEVDGAFRGRIVGKVHNILVLAEHGLRRGEEIEVSMDNVLDIKKR